MLYNFVFLQLNNNSCRAEAESAKIFLFSRINFEVFGLGLEAQVLSLGLEAYKSLKIPYPQLEGSIIFWLVKKEITKLKTA